MGVLTTITTAARMPSASSGSCLFVLVTLATIVLCTGKLTAEVQADQEMREKLRQERVLVDTLLRDEAPLVGPLITDEAMLDTLVNEASKEYDSMTIREVKGKGGTWKRSARDVPVMELEEVVDPFFKRSRRWEEARMCSKHYTQECRAFMCKQTGPSPARTKSLPTRGKLDHTKTKHDSVPNFHSRGLPFNMKQPRSGNKEHVA